MKNLYPNLLRICQTIVFGLAILPLGAQSTSSYNQCGPDLAAEAESRGNFGQTLAISGNGDVVAVGALLEGDTNSGTVRLYRRAGESYLPLGDPITTSVPNALFGRAIALNEDGTRLAFSSSLRLNTSGNVQIGFTVFVYDISADGYQNTATISGAPGTGSFGAALDLSDDGTRMVIGDPDGGNFGRVHLYDLEASTGQWRQFDELEETTFSGDFGSSVAISGDGLHLLAGAESPGGDNDLDDVQQYLFNQATGRFELVRTYVGQFGSADFGVAVDIDDDGNTFMIADDGADVGVDLEGYVAVWRYRDDGSIRFFANVVTPPTDSQFGQFGSAAALSRDGNTLVVADYNFSSPENSVGRVYIYNIPEDGRLSLISSNIIGDESLFFTGRAVAVSTDGQRVAVGSSLANGNDGLARIYSTLCNPVSSREPTLNLPDLRVYSDASALNVDYGKDMGGAQVTSTLFTIDGRSVASRADRGGTGFSWRLGLPHGLYVIRLVSEGRVVSRRVVW